MGITINHPEDTYGQGSIKLEPRSTDQRRSFLHVKDDADGSYASVALSLDLDDLRNLREVVNAEIGRIEALPEPTVEWIAVDKMDPHYTYTIDMPEGVDMTSATESFRAARIERHFRNATDSRVTEDSWFYSPHCYYWVKADVK